MPEPENTPGDSEILRHGATKSPRYGFSEHSTLDNIAKREAEYVELFGADAVVYDDELPGMVPHIDVYVHRPGYCRREFYTLVTSGMSDLRMKLPEGAPRDMPARVELVFYLPPEREPDALYAEFLRTTARFPYDYDTWVSGGHTIPNGTPPQPIFPGTPFDTILLIGSVINPDNALGDRLVLGGDRVELLWVVPITGAEREYKRKHGTAALLDLFDKVQHPFAFDPARKSYL